MACLLGILYCVTWQLAPHDIGLCTHILFCFYWEYVNKNTSFKPQMCKYQHPKLLFLYVMYILTGIFLDQTNFVNDSVKTVHDYIGLCFHFRAFVRLPKFANLQEERNVTTFWMTVTYSILHIYIYLYNINYLIIYNLYII